MGCFFPPRAPGKQHTSFLCPELSTLSNPGNAGWDSKELAVGRASGSSPELTNRKKGHNEPSLFWFWKGTWKGCGRAEQAGSSSAWKVMAKGGLGRSPAVLPFRVMLRVPSVCITPPGRQQASGHCRPRSWRSTSVAEVPIYVRASLELLRLEWVLHGADGKVCNFLPILVHEHMDLCLSILGKAANPTALWHLLGSLESVPPKGLLFLCLAGRQTGLKLNSIH